MMIIYFFITRKTQNPDTLFKEKETEKAENIEQTGIFKRKSMFCIVVWERGKAKWLFHGTIFFNEYNF